MVLGLSLSLLGLLGLAVGAKGVSDRADAASSVMPDASSDVWSESQKFTEKYMSDTVVDDSSNEPYITSAEIVRPTLGGGGSKSDRKIGEHAFLGGLGLGSVFSLASDRKNRWWLVIGLLAGGYVVYKVVK